MEKIVNTAVIGIGNMGRNHVRNYFEIKKSNLVAIADLNEELGKDLSKKYNCKYYKDYNEMLERENIDALTIAVPSKFHHQVGIDVLKRSIHTLVEKPIAMTLENGRDLIKTAAKNNAKLMIGHIERFNPGVQKLKRLIASGRFGEITSIVAKRVGVFPPQIKDANVLIDLAVHDIDIINFLTGKHPDSIDCNGGRAIISNREDYAEIFLKYQNLSGFIQVNWITPVKIRTLSITGTKGYAELNYITQRLQLFYSNYSKFEDNFGDFVVKFGDPETVDIKVQKKEPLKSELESFLDSVIKNKPIATSGEEGLKALEIALKSMEIIINRS